MNKEFILQLLVNDSTLKLRRKDYIKEFKYSCAELNMNASDKDSAKLQQIHLQTQQE
jgi:hypothetical protein